MLLAIDRLLSRYMPRRYQLQLFLIGRLRTYLLQPEAAGVCAQYSSAEEGGVGTGLTPFHLRWTRGACTTVHGD